YSRVATTWTAPANGQVTGSQVTIDLAAGSYTHAGLWTALTGGTFIDKVAIPATTPGGQGTLLIPPTLTISRPSPDRPPPLPRCRARPTVERGTFHIRLLWRNPLWPISPERRGYPRRRRLPQLSRHRRSARSPCPRRRCPSFPARMFRSSFPSSGRISPAAGT